MNKEPAGELLLAIRIVKDGEQWCALLGENIQEGVSGFGETPFEAFESFARNVELEDWIETQE